MARRFYDSGLINQRWYMELPPKFKALYIHCLCACDCAGIFEVNPIMLSAMVGEPIKEEDIFNALGNRVIPLPGYKALLVDFVCFQCGGELKGGCRPHDAIIKRLKEVGMSVGDLQKVCNHELNYTPFKPKETVVIEPVSKVSSLRVEPSNSARDNEQIVEMFQTFWKAYPRHDAKQSAYKKFTTILKEVKSEERAEFVGKMIAAVNAQKKSDQWTKDNGQFIPMPTTWLNQRRWEDEGVVKPDEHCDDGISPSAKLSASILGNLKI